MSKLLRVPKNVSIEYCTEPGFKECCTISWNCCELFARDSDEAQTIIDMLVHESELEQQVESARIEAILLGIELSNWDPDSRPVIAEIHKRLISSLTTGDKGNE